MSYRRLPLDNVAMNKPEKPKWDIIGLTFATKGIKHVFVTERNLKIHIVIAVLVALAAIFFSLSVFETIIIIFAISIVIFAEIVNTSIETIVDLICIDVLKDKLDESEYNAKAKLSKDIAAGAVLITAVMSAIVGILVFLPKIIDRIASI